MAETATTAPTSTAAAEPHLRRVLSLWDLIFYGIVLIQPIAAVPLFGIAQKDSGGHAVLTILAGMVAFLLTAVSYGRMAALYPAAGSAYTYVGKGLNPHFGFLAGWAMFLGYLVLPLINVVYVAVTLHRVFPRVPYVAAAGGFALVITLLNLLGIRSTARANQVLLAAMCAVIGAFIILGIRYVARTAGAGGLLSLHPFYNPQTFDLHSIATATAFAALTYIGFDGVTTLAEDVQNPRRNVLLAVVLVVLFTGIFSSFLCYLGQLVWPNYLDFPNLETAFMDVCRRVGGLLLYDAMAVILIVASFGSGLTGQVGAARILFGMGRDNVLPRKVFSYLDPRRNTPAVNIWMIGALAFAGGLVLTYESAADILNFGAFVAFMGVNVAAFWQFYVRRPRSNRRGHEGRERRLIADAIVPLLGFVSCFAIWLSLPRQAMVVGGAFLLAGFAIAAVKTRGFRTRPVMIDFHEA
ncbi:MAG TPA: APC family permease [Terriglobia bacterium]|nr:APC family permease [Terriglobia bacterium]